MDPVHRPKIIEIVSSHPHEGEEEHSHPHKPRERRQLLLSVALTGGMMIVETIGGLFSGSLALLSDAGHMFTHFFALLMSLFAILIAARPVNFEKTYGYFRVEVLTALFNGLLLIGVSFFIFYEAYERFFHPISVKTFDMFVIALLGLGVNILTGYFLYEVRHRDLNLKSAFAHMLSDALSSVGVVVAALVIYYTQWTQIDPLLSGVIGLLILFWAARLVRDSIHILMESTPKHIDMHHLLSEVKEEVGGIRELHDVHIWEITTHMYAMTAHVTVEECSVSECMRKTEKINHLLAERYHIEHVNLQYEC